MLKMLHYQIFVSITHKKNVKILYKYDIFNYKGQH